MRWRAADDIPSASVFIVSPYDGDAHDARKGTTSWIGDKIHVIAACGDDAPRLITHVETTTAPVIDAAALSAVQQALLGRGLLPAVQLVDADDRDSPQIVAAHEDYGVALRGLARPDDQWQARAEWLRARRFPARLGAGTGDLPGRADE